MEGKSNGQLVKSAVEEEYRAAKPGYAQNFMPAFMRSPIPT
jgi:hypothetical protein